VLSFPIDSTPSRELDEPKKSESINNSTPPRDAPAPYPCASKTPPPFPNRMKWKKAQSQVYKIRKTFFVIKINVPLLDAIQQMPLCLFS